MRLFRVGKFYSLASGWRRRFYHAPAGLFGNVALQRPEDFMKLAQGAVETSERLRQRLISGATPPGKQAVRELDDISNSLCLVIDAAELTRNVHQEEAWREAAEEVFSAISEYLHELNTDVGLYRTVKRVVDQPSLMASLSEEELRTADLLKTEFESSGIHLPDAERTEVRALLNEVTRLETLFSSNIVVQTHHFQRADLEAGLPKHLLRAILPPPGEVSEAVMVAADQTLANVMLRHAHDEKLRRKIYRELNTTPVDNVRVLEDLVKARDALARKLGFKSHAHRFTSDKMARNPERVEAFLFDLASHIKDRAQAELDLLRDIKYQQEGSRDLQQWDLPRYLAMAKSAAFDLDTKALSCYFSLKAVLQGLALLCKSLFGITMQRVPIHASETWAYNQDDVQKVVLVHPVEGVLGTIYLDLYPRPGKYTHHAQFTVRCGCQPGDDAPYQLPVVALVCNFSPSSEKHDLKGDERDSATLLSHGEVESLFHEFGHALHSLLSRTKCQHVAGTRAPTDFVETPSHLLEYFAWDPRFLSQFARHHKTGQPIPTEWVKALAGSRSMFGALDTQTQVLYSLVDQRLFGPQPTNHAPVSSSFLADVQTQVTTLPHAEGTYWHARFGHLVGYGAGYYAYLYGRIFASHIWHKLFEADPLSEASGEALWKKMLIHGGGKDPNCVLRDVLGEEPSTAAFLRELGVKSLK